jgi:GNAT superfamily N-acetyltransferase
MTSDHTELHQRPENSPADGIAAGDLPATAVGGSNRLPRVEIRRVHPGDREWVESMIRKHWASNVVVVDGRTHRPDMLPGFIALLDQIPAGLVTYRVGESICEIITLDSFVPRVGIGRRLVEAVIASARSSDCSRVDVTTTNDNVTALAFYQKLGFRLKQLHVDAVDTARAIKPQIPDVAENGIPIRDELLLSMSLQG